MRIWRIGIVVSLFSGWTGGLLAQPGLQVVAVNPLEKVFKDTRIEPEAETVLRFEAAANEFESAQLVIRSDTGLEGLSLELSDLALENGQEVISASNLEWRFVGYVPVERNTTEAECGRHRDIPKGELLR